MLSYLLAALQDPGGDIQEMEWFPAVLSNWTRKWYPSN